MICVLVAGIFGTIMLTPGLITALKEKYHSTYIWVMEFFIWDKVQATGKTENTLTTLFGKMYFLPDQFNTWLIGEGRFVTSSGAPYRDTDPFYMRFLLFWGMPGIIVYIYFLKTVISNIVQRFKQILVVKKNSYNENSFRLLIFMIFLQALLINVKSIYRGWGYLFLFMNYLIMEYKKIEKEKGAEI